MDSGRDASVSDGSMIPAADGPFVGSADAGAMQDGGVADLKVSEQSYSFGAVELGQSAQHTLTVSNNGLSPTGQVHITMGGADATAFSFDASGCEGHTLDPNTGCPIVVTFSTTTQPTKHGILMATASPGGTVSADLDGSGLAPGALSSDPPSLDFEMVVQGDSSTIPVTIKNTSSTATQSLTASITGSNSDQFSLMNDNCNMQSLPGMSTCTLVVAFAPTMTGTKTAQLNVGDGTRSVTAGLSGVAVSPGVLTITVQPGFANVTLPGSTTGTVTVKNTGGATLYGLSTVLSGTNKADFSFSSDGCNGKMLAAGSTCSATITFQPSAVGSKSATFGISADSGASTSTGLSARAFATLTIVLDGKGAGSVTSNPTGISCTRAGGACSHDFDVASVGISESSPTNSQFDGWAGGGCAKFGPCTVTLSASQTIHASFTTTSACVDPTSGSDTNDGTCTAPFKTIAKALAVLGGLPATVQLKPGTYSPGSNGETFPIALPDGISLIGDEANKGNGASPVTLLGEVDAGSTSTIAGLKVTGATFGIAIANPIANVTIRNNTITQGQTGIYINCDWPCSASGHTITGNVITNNSSNGISVFNSGALVQDNLISGNSFGVLLRGVDTVPDFVGGAYSSTGHNVLSCNTTMDVDYNLDQFAQLFARDNYWDHNPPTAGRDALHNFSPGIDYFTYGSGGELDAASPMVASSPCP